MKTKLLREALKLMGQITYGGAREDLPVIESDLEEVARELGVTSEKLWETYRVLRDPTPDEDFMVMADPVAEAGLQQIGPH